MLSNRSDFVVQSEIIKAQEALEKKAREEWNKKWNFYLNFNKICIEEATKKGISKEGFRKRLVRKNNKESGEEAIWKAKPSTYFPVTTYGVIGWRGQQEYSLEKFGSLYTSPKLTLPYEPPYSSIMLG